MKLGVVLQVFIVRDEQIASNYIWRRIEVVITGLTRNQLAGQPARGFESRRLRYRIVALASVTGECFLLTL